MIEVTELLTLLGLGVLLGIEHALDSDHVIAVSAIVSRTKNLKKSTLFGIIWGMGHTTTLFLAGISILVLKLSIPPKLTLSFELLVGIVLVILGIDVLRNAIKNKFHIHIHRHDTNVHAHFHSHKKSLTHMHSHTAKSFIIGMIHGLAGSSALMLLVLTTVKSILQGMLYILTFGFGSIIGMLIISTIIGFFFISTRMFSKINYGLRVSAGILSIIFGVVIIYEIGFISGLFF